MKKLLMVCTLMLLVMASMAQVRSKPRTPPVKKAKTGTTKTIREKKTTQTPVILNNRNIQKIDPKVVQKNQPVIGNTNILNSEKQKEANKAAEEIRNTPPKKTVIMAPLKPEVVAVAVIPKKYKLKITATDAQTIKKSNKHKFEEYGIMQDISYVTQGRTKVPDEYIVKGSKRSPYQTPYNKKNRPELYELVHYNIFGPLKVGSYERTSMNINSSFIYTISESELSDPEAKMTISTSLGEKSGSGGWLPFDYENNDIEVSIKDVLAILVGKRKLYATQPYFDKDVAKGISFDDFGGFKMNLTKVNIPDKTVLEGPIRKRTNSGKEKAAVWVRFELVE